MTIPTTVRVSSLSDWNHFFHPTEGLFRTPSEISEVIQHLDIDLRFIDSGVALHPEHGVHLPNVCKLTLRAGEFCQDHDERMEVLAEVLFSINPVEVNWILAISAPGQGQTLAVHLVHPAIIMAGEEWSRRGILKRLVLQGGFPLPNLTAPTPYSITPAHTPLPSPGPTKAFFNLSRPSSPNGHKSHLTLSTLPQLSLTKPKPVDDSKIKERAERKRLAEFTLKPRFDFAFGSWRVQEIIWRLDGGYKPETVTNIMKHYFKSVNETFPSATSKDDVELPSVVAFTSFPLDIVDQIRSLPDDLGIRSDAFAWLEDTIFVSDISLFDEGRLARLWSVEPEERERQTARIKASLLLAAQDIQVIPFDELHGSAPPPTAASLPIPSALTTGANTYSPAASFQSLMANETDPSSESESDEARTPEMDSSMVMDCPEIPCPNDAEQGKVQQANQMHSSSRLVAA